MVKTAIISSNTPSCEASHAGWLKAGQH